MIDCCYICLCLSFAFDFLVPSLWVLHLIWLSFLGSLLSIWLCLFLFACGIQISEFSFDVD